MARLVDLRAPFPAAMTLRPGDMVNCAAAGGIVEEGAAAIEPIGPFVPAVVATDGRTISPETGPTSMLFRALRPGRARLVLFVGGGLMPVSRHAVDVVVEPGDAVTQGAPTVPK